MLLGKDKWYESYESVNYATGLQFNLDYLKKIGYSEQEIFHPLEIQLKSTVNSQ